MLTVPFHPTRGTFSTVNLLRPIVILSNPQARGQSFLLPSGSPFRALDESLTSRTVDPSHDQTPWSGCSTSFRLRSGPQTSVLLTSEDRSLLHEVRLTTLLGVSSTSDLPWLPPRDPRDPVVQRSLRREVTDLFTLGLPQWSPDRSRKSAREDLPRHENLRDREVRVWREVK